MINPSSSSLWSATCYEKSVTGIQEFLTLHGFSNSCDFAGFWSEIMFLGSTTMYFSRSVDSRGLFLRISSLGYPFKAQTAFRKNVCKKCLIRFTNHLLRFEAVTWVGNSKKKIQEINRSRGVHNRRAQEHYPTPNPRKVTGVWKSMQC